MLDRESLASDVLENWTPPELDTHPDDTPRAFDDDGRPLAFPKARQVTGPCWDAIQGAGGTWWHVSPTAFDVATPPAASKAFGRWLRAAKRRYAGLPGDTTQKLAPLARACEAVPVTPEPEIPGHDYTRKGMEARQKIRDDFRAWQKSVLSRVRFVGVDTATGETVLSLACDETHARAIVEAYGIAGRPLVLRPA